MWAQQSLSTVRGRSAGIGERISFGAVGMPGFALEGRLAGPGDPDVYMTLTPDQQKWVVDTLVALNNRIYQATGTTCPTWGPSVTAAGGCFQAWFNSVNAGAPIKKLRTDGVFDQDTLDALITTTQIHKTDFPTPFPAGSTKKKLSTASMVGIGALGVAGVGGIIYAVSSGGGKRRRRRR